MRKLSTVFFTMIAAVAACALTVGAGMGFEAVDTSVFLTSPKDWLHSFTMHSDGLLLANAGAAVATKDIKEKLDQLGKNLNAILGDGGLEDQIKEVEHSASMLKEQVEKRSLDNAEYVDKIKELVADANIERTKEMLTERFDEFEMKVLDGQKGTGKRPEIGKGALKAVKDAGLSSRSGKGDGARYEEDGVTIKDITNADASAGDAVYSDRREDIVEMPLRTPRIVDLLTVISTNSDSIDYIIQESETDNAGPQENQGDTVGKSDWTFGLESAPVVTVSHYARAAMQILDDQPRLQGFVNRRMTALLNLELEDEVLLGDGTGGQLSGLVPNSTAYDTNLESAVLDGTATDLDKIRVGMLQVQRATLAGKRVNLQPTGIVMSPLNWAAIELTKTTEGSYLFVNPQNQTGPRLWGLPVVPTNAMEEGEAHVGNYSMAATLYDRMQAGVQISTEDAENFRQLMVSFRTFLRAALAIEFSEALVHIDSMNATAPSAGS